MSFIGCPLLLQNMHTNYLFGIYLTLFKQSQTNMSMCILTHEIISNVIELNKIHIELYTMMFIPSVDYDFTILFDMCDTAPHNIHNDLYIIGTIHWRGTRQLVFRVNRSFFELTQWTHRDVDYHLKMYCSYFLFSTWTWCIWWDTNTLWILNLLYENVVFSFYLVQTVFYYICMMWASPCSSQRKLWKFNKKYQTS